MFFLAVPVQKQDEINSVITLLSGHSCKYLQIKDKHGNLTLWNELFTFSAI